jgi:S-DNA-T family DNA segregation ATPase FtsK/SpoIIIE
MLDERKLRLDLIALSLLVLAVFLTLAVVSYDPADPPSATVWPANPHIRNACGRIGALVAHVSMQGLGVGAYYAVISLAIAGVLLMRRQRVTEPILRALGWSLSLVGLVTLVAMLLPSASPGPVIGPGGYLGASMAGLLRAHFAGVGACLLATSLLVCGLLLCTDYVLLQFSSWMVMTPARGVGRGLARARDSYSRRTVGQAVRTDDEHDLEDSSVSIKIRGKSIDVETTDEDEVDDTVEAENPVVVVKSDSVSAPEEKPDGLRIVNPSQRKKPDRQELIAQIEATTQQETVPQNYELPTTELLQESEPVSFDEHEKDVRRKAKILERTFSNFGYQVRVVEIETGPVIAQFEVELEAGLRLSKITSLADDLAIALRVPSVRIVAPIPGKNTVGIEVPNVERQIVRLREVMEETNGKAAKMQVPLFLGKDVAGKPMAVDLASLPHLLIAGRTGTGKSVCLNTIIMSILMTRRPDEVKMLLIDPKMVELTPYTKLPHLMHPVVTDMKKAEAILAWAVDKMEERYALLARAGVRHISVYNQLGRDELYARLQPGSDAEKAEIPTQLPYIVIVADEMADLMMTAAKEVEGHIIRLAQKSRAVGIHLVLATQKPTVDVITGLIKSNLPARISFQVASRTDSRVVLDEMGADKLLGNGDMLFLWPGTSTLLRGQGAYVSDEEINRVVGVVGTNEPQFAKELVHLPVATSGDAKAINRERDELYQQSVEIVIREGRGSVSLLQRALGIGYGRGARLIDYMAEDGIVGQYNGSQAREVLMTIEQWQELCSEGNGPGAPPQNRGRVVAFAPRTPEYVDEEETAEEADEQDSDDDELAGAADGSLDDDIEEEAEIDEWEGEEEAASDEDEVVDEDEEDEDVEEESEDETPFDVDDDQESSPPRGPHKPTSRASRRRRPA